MIDLMIGMFVLVMGALSFFALFPTVHRSHTLAAEETKAVQIAARFIEHIQLLKPADLNVGTLTDLNLIDPGQSGLPYTFTNIPLDDASQYSPSTVLKGGRASVDITPIDAGSVRVDITIQWRSASNTSRSYTTGTIVGGHK